MKKQKNETNRELPGKKRTSSPRGARQTNDPADSREESTKRPRVRRAASGGYATGDSSRRDFRERRDGSFVKIDRETDRKPTRDRKDTFGKQAPREEARYARTGSDRDGYTPRKKKSREPEERRFTKPTLYGRPAPSEDRPERRGATGPAGKHLRERPAPDAPANSGFRKRDVKNAPRSGRNSAVQEEKISEGALRRTGKFEKAPDYRLPKKEKAAARDTSAGDGSTRLNRYIANAGICSRREADELITGGLISVNGEAVTEMGFKVRPGDIVKYGKRVLNPEKMVYILLNKPKDYLTTTSDPEERKTVMDLIEGACKERVYPVGRLDRNTTGLLLLTNDGETAGKLTHPSGNIRKLYQAELDKPITTEDFETLQKGVELEDGFIKPDSLGIVTPDAYVVGIEIHSGRNRIVRRMFEHLGYEVKKLDRTVFAGLDKKDLPRGKWRFLTEKEVIRLKFLV